LCWLWTVWAKSLAPDTRSHIYIYWPAKQHHHFVVGTACPTGADGCQQCFCYNSLMIWFPHPGFHALPQAPYLFRCEVIWRKVPFLDEEHSGIQQSSCFSLPDLVTDDWPGLPNHVGVCVWLEVSLYKWSWGVNTMWHACLINVWHCKVTKPCIIACLPNTATCKMSTQ